MLNKVFLIGRITANPELQYTAQGIARTSFTVAINRPYTSSAGEQVTDFIDVIAWRKLAENCAQYLQKGNLVAIEGRLEVNNYTKSDGQKMKITKVMAQTVNFLERRKGVKTQTENDGWSDIGEEVENE